jgi:hypothetical protein
MSLGVIFRKKCALSRYASLPPVTSLEHFHVPRSYTNLNAVTLAATSDKRCYLEIPIFFNLFLILFPIILLHAELWVQQGAGYLEQQD